MTSGPRGGLEDTLLRETIDGPGASSSRIEEVDALPRGSIIGRYVVLERIGSGGMGVVYAAYDPDLDRRVALKVLRTKVTEEQTESRARSRLLREGQAMAKLRHPNVIAVHDVGTDAGRVFIAMEFIDGSTLGDWLAGERRSVADVLEVFRAAGEGLAAAHRQGLIHRDFKPDNVLVGRDGRVCVVDFGLARRDSLSPDGLVSSQFEAMVSDERPPDPEVIDSASDGLAMSITNTGMLLGTPAYMAPEQHLGLLPGAASDQFSFCVAIYEALYGERPFEGDNPAELLVNVTEAEIRPAPARSRVPWWIRRVLLRGLERRPRERWPDMEALLDALARSPGAHRHLWMGSMAALAVSVGAFGFWVSQQPAEPKCDRGESSWAGLWDEEAKGHYAAAFHETGKSFADAAWNAVARDGDAYVEAWGNAYEEACAATHVRHEQSAQVLELRRACLDGARTRFATVTELFADADDDVVTDAVDAIGALPEPTCGFEEVLREDARLPTEPLLRSVLESQRSKLDRAAALSRANRLDAASKLIEQVIGRARELDDAALEAEALLARADMQEARGMMAEARASSEAALLLSEAHDEDRVAARAWMDLVWFDGFRNSRYEAAHAAADHARALLSRWPNSIQQQVLLTSREGDLLYAEGRYEQALAKHRRALAQRQQHDAPHDPRRADALTGIGLCELELGRYDDALNHLREAEKVYRGAYGAGHPHTAAALTNLGMAHDYRGELGDAERLHLRALKVAEAAHGGDHPTVAEILNNYAAVLYALERYDGAREAFVRARGIWKHRYGLEHPDLAMIDFNLAQVAESQGDLAKARSLHAQALLARERGLGPDHPDVADSLEALAALDLLAEDRVRAVEHLSRALAIRSMVGGTDGKAVVALQEQLRELSAPPE
ncbi:MAG: serine/threonine-protein kinase [Myxococcota bacterium]